MANEIQATFALQVINGNVTDTLGQFTESVTQSGAVVAVTTPGVPTSDTVITIPSEVSTLGKVFIRNLSATNYVEFGPTVSSAIAPMVKLKPGEFVWLRLSPGVVLRGRANTAAVSCVIRFYND